LLGLQKAKSSKKILKTAHEPLPSGERPKKQLRKMPSIDLFGVRQCLDGRPKAKRPKALPPWRQEFDYTGAEWNEVNGAGRRI